MRKDVLFVLFPVFIMICVFAAGFKEYTTSVASHNSAVPAPGLYQFKVTEFTGIFSDNKVLLNWSVDSNALIDFFEVEKSTAGKNYITAAMVFSSEKKGRESYPFKETSNEDRIFYRVKVTARDKRVIYSHTLQLSRSN